MRPTRANEPCMQNAQCHAKMHYRQQKYYRGCEDSNRRSPASGHAGQAKHGWYGAIVTKQLRQKQRNSVALALQSHELILEHRTRFMMCTGNRTIILSKPTLMGLEPIGPVRFVKKQAEILFRLICCEGKTLFQLKNKLKKTDYKINKHDHN